MPRPDPADERLAGLRRRLNGLAYGGDYDAEQWPPAVWREGVRLMREAGVNPVTVGVFSWGLLEPRPGVHEFGWLDEVMDLPAEAGVGVDLATPTAAPPSWLAHEHPRTLPVDAEGRNFAFGARLHYCATPAILRSPCGTSATSTPASAATARSPSRTSAAGSRSGMAPWRR
nr:beta-galactosidase [Streptomyces cyaneochromogenes]